MVRHTSLLACLLAIATCAAAEVKSSPDVADVRNLPDVPDVLLITIDTLRADHLGAYGFPLAISPSIDRLASQGIVFERAIAASAATGPSHASIMTSRYPRHHSVGYGNGVTTLVGGKTLAELFAEHGYATGAFIGNMILQRPSGLARGFQRYDGKLEKPEGSRQDYLERTAKATTQRALAWLRAREPAKPVFLWVHYQDPHGPYSPPAGEAKRFELPREPNEAALPVLQNDSGLNGIPAYQALPGLFRASEYRSRYADEIRYADRWIGRLINRFQRRAGGGSSGPIILLTADHGESLGEAGRYFVHSYSTAPDNAHVPLILLAPGLDPGRIASLASHVDVMPTLAELAGLPWPETSDGVALGPLVRGEAPSPSDRFVYCDMGDRVSAYRGSEFLRISGAASAWNRGTTRRKGIPDPTWVPHDWTAGSLRAPAPNWSARSAEGPLPESVRDYVLYAEEMIYLWELSPERQEALRAMGYGG